MAVKLEGTTDKEVISEKSPTLKKRGRKPGSKNKTSKVKNSIKETVESVVKNIKPKRNIKNIGLKTNSVEKDLNDISTSPVPPKVKRTLHLNLGNAKAANSVVVEETTTTENFDKAVSFEDVVKENNIIEENIVDVKEDVEENVVDVKEDVEENVVDVKENVEENVVDVKEDVEENVVDVKENVEENSNTEIINNLILSTSVPHTVDTSVNQNSPFFYSPSVFDKYNVDITYLEEDDKEDVQEEEYILPEVEADENLEYYKNDIEKNVVDVVEDVEEINQVQDDVEELEDDSINELEINSDDEFEENSNEEIIEDDFDDIDNGEELVTKEESNNTEKGEDEDFDFVSYDNFDIYALKDDVIEEDSSEEENVVEHVEENDEVDEQPAEETKETSKKDNIGIINTSIPDDGAFENSNLNNGKISNIAFELIDKILEVEQEVEKEAAGSYGNSPVFKKFSFGDSSILSSRAEAKEIKSVLGSPVNNIVAPQEKSLDIKNNIPNEEPKVEIKADSVGTLATPQVKTDITNDVNDTGYNIDYSNIITPEQNTEDVSSIDDEIANELLGNVDFLDGELQKINSDDSANDEEYDDNTFSVEKYFGIKKVSSEYNNDDEADDQPAKENDDADLDDEKMSAIENTNLDDILLEKIYEDDLKGLDLSEDLEKDIEKPTNPDDPASDLISIAETLSKAIAELENSDVKNEPSLLENEGKAINILINKDDIFSISILNETYEIVADFDGISVISENIHISTPKNNFFVKVGEKYIEIHNKKDCFTVYTNFENVDFENAINNVKFTKKPDKLELNIKEAFKLSSVKNKIQLSMLNTVIADMTASQNPDNIDENSICDNRTLLISEETQKVYLPYTLEEIMQKLNNNPEYKTAKDVIDNEYTLPLSNFKMPVVSRFKEAYRFMRLKEKTSVYAAIDLALELMFNSDLNPAIIRACKDLRELNIYLDCLYENELEKFDCFKIVYKLLPKIK